MPGLSHLFGIDRAWADPVIRARPDFLDRLLGRQAPRYLWTGCSCGRLPANEIGGLLPGELFVHRSAATL